MKIFISSVRRGLEEERDALPGLISALGHEPRRFEDYTAKPVPSREACLAGVEDVSVYVLMLGEHYGDRLPDTGKAPTEEEFTVARRRGIPILVFRKRGGTPDDDQAGFIDRVEDYAAGRFRGGFTTTAELLTQVAGAIRGLDLAPAALQYDQLASPVNAPWKAFGNPSSYSQSTLIEIHVIPIPPTRLSATTLAGLPVRLARTGRELGFFTEDQGLETGLSEGSARAATRPDRDVRSTGIRMVATGTVSIWQEMPSDWLGVILEPSDLASRIAPMLRLATQLLPSVESVAIAIGLFGLGRVTEGAAAEVGHRTSGTLSLRQAEAALVEAQDSLPLAALPRAADEIARELAMRLIHRFRETT